MITLSLSMWQMVIDMAWRFRQKQPAVALQLAKEEANSSIISEVDVVIDNHVFLNSWSRDYVVPNVDVRYCVGVHPRMVNGLIPWRKLEARFQDSRCVGIGESRLDTTAPDMESQKVQLKEVASLTAQHGKPLVLHVRDDQQGIDGLFQTVLHILYTPMTPGHTLYLHSYTGGWETALAFRKWSPIPISGLVVPRCIQRNSQSWLDIFPLNVWSWSWMHLILHHLGTLATHHTFWDTSRSRWPSIGTYHQHSSWM